MSSNFPQPYSTSFLWILSLFATIMLPTARSGVDLRLRTYPNGFLYEEVFSITGNEFSIITSTAGGVVVIALLYLLYNNYIYSKFLRDSSETLQKSNTTTTSNIASSARPRSIAQLDANTQNRIISALQDTRFQDNHQRHHDRLSHHKS